MPASSRRQASHPGRCRGGFLKQARQVADRHTGQSAPSHSGAKKFLTRACWAQVLRDRANPRREARMKRLGATGSVRGSVDHQRSGDVGEVGLRRPHDVRSPSPYCLADEPAAVILRRRSGWRDCCPHFIWPSSGVGPAKSLPNQQDLHDPPKSLRSTVPAFKGIRIAGACLRFPESFHRPI